MVVQDLPPPGGFGLISVERTLPRPLIRQSILFGIGVGVSIYGFNHLAEWRKRYRILRIEQQEHYNAVHPFLVAEQERKYLMQLWRLREEERELMKDHPGWKLGTLYGEPIYKTIPKGYIPPVPASEFAAHRPYDEWLYKVVVPDLWN